MLCFVNAYDIGAILLVLIFAVMGAIRGFTWEAGSLISVFLGVAAANRLTPVFSSLFLKGISDSYAPVIGFVSVFILVFILVIVLTYYTKRLVDGAKLKRVDKTLGFFFGIFQGAAICLLITLVLLRFGSDELKRYVANTQTSRIVSRVVSCAPQVFSTPPLSIRYSK
ncbi:MAG: CvpA family protein [Planctomycetota bacterium]|nr:CvpA family protein [Planctomycetota bacterium]